MYSLVRAYAVRVSVCVCDRLRSVDCDSLQTQSTQHTQLRTGLMSSALQLAVAHQLGNEYCRTGSSSIAVQQCYYEWSLLSPGYPVHSTVIYL